ncbi:MAG: hypothetical protein H7842_02550 [Gammaproteobacteria bacterium SHHR-1]
MALLHVATADDLAAQERAQEQELLSLEQKIESGLSAHIDKHWEINRRAKDHVTPILEQCLRQRNGVYDPEDLDKIANEGGSQIYMMLTATRVRAAGSWINDLLFAGDQMFGTEPTPVADLPEPIKAELQQKLLMEVQQALQAGQPPPPQMVKQRVKEFKGRMMEALQEEAEQRAKKMETKIRDQFVDSGLKDTLIRFVEDFCTYPAAILKGPVYRMKDQLEWAQDYTPIVAQKLCAEDERVSPFDFFPSPGVENPNHGHVIEVVRYTRSELSAMRQQECYKAEAIEDILDNGDNGSDVRGQVDNLEYDNGRHGADYDDDGLIWGLLYYGRARGKDLADWGLEVEDEYEEYEIEALKIGRHVIKCAINQDPLKRRPYYITSWQREAGTMWGKSIPQLMRDIQRMCNAAARALSNNLGLASGPQILVYRDLVPDGEEVTGVYPLKVWNVVSDPQGRQVEPVKFFQPSSNARELIEVYDRFEQKADDATNVPRYSYGNEKVKGAGQTMGGLSMLLENATKAIKDAVLHIDQDIVQPRVRRQFEDNMLYEQNDEIKGDMKVVARGATVLVAKAAAQQRRNEFLQIVGKVPQFNQLLGIRGYGAILREMIRDMDLPGYGVPDDDKLKEMEAKMQQEKKPPEKIMLEQMRNEIKMQIEQMRMQRRQEEGQIRVQEKQLDRDVKLAQHQDSMQLKLMELATNKEMTAEQLKARLGELAIKLRGERQMLADEALVKELHGSGL